MFGIKVEEKTGRHTMKTLKPIPGFSKYGITQCARLFTLASGDRVKNYKMVSNNTRYLAQPSFKSKTILHHPVDLDPPWI